MAVGRNKGFTLIELMVSISILGILAVTATTIFFRTFRGSGKTETLVTVEQSGTYLLSIMERFIKGALQVTAVGDGNCPGSGESLSLVNADGGETVFALSEGSITSNSAKISPSEVTISDLLFDCTRTSGAPDKIAVSFDLTYTNQAEGAESDQTFTSTYVLRNF
jgi:prepilin-type N-terminal cleavage/methylation domain-containing protein